MTAKRRTRDAGHPGPRKPNEALWIGGAAGLVVVVIIAFVATRGGAPEPEPELQPKAIAKVEAKAGPVDPGPATAPAATPKADPDEGLVDKPMARQHPEETDGIGAPVGDLCDACSIAHEKALEAMANLARAGERMRRPIDRNAQLEAGSVARASFLLDLAAARKLPKAGEHCADCAALDRWWTESGAAARKARGVPSR